MTDQKLLSKFDLQNLAQSIKTLRYPPYVVASSPLFWFVHWTRHSLGYFALRRYLRQSPWKFKLASKSIKSLISAFLRPSYTLKMPARIECNGNLIFSWCNGSEVANVIEGKDRYFGSLIHPSESKTLRIYILHHPYTEQDVFRLNEQGFGVIFQPSSSNSRLRDLIGALKRLPRNLHSLPKMLNYDVLCCALLVEKIQEMAKKLQLKQAYFPYEGQPMQNNIIYKLQEIGVASVGYIHSSAQNFPSFLIHRAGSPNELLVHGNDTQYVLEEYCGWPKGSVLTVDCFRFRKRPKSEFESKIFLPYSFDSKERMLEIFLKLFDAYPDFFSSGTDVRIHPDMKAAAEHIALATAIRAALPKQQSTKTCTVISGISTAILEALENDVEHAFHVSESPYFEVFSESLWPGIETTEILPNIFKYRLRKKGSFLLLKDKPSSFDELVQARTVKRAASHSSVLSGGQQFDSHFP